MTAEQIAAGLKPCPEGHRTGLVAQWPSFDHQWRFYGFCACCGHKTHGADTEAEAIAAWNRRAPERNPDND